jgi:hypothetical protein
MLVKVLMYSYATGVFSSRAMAQNCGINLAYLFLTRGERPSYHVLSDSRTIYGKYLNEVWLALVATASSQGMTVLGKLSIDSCRFKANASGDLVVAQKDYDALLARMQELIDRSRQADANDDDESFAARTQTGVNPSKITIRSVVRSVGKDSPKGTIHPKTEKRLHECVSTLNKAQEEGLGFVSLSDPDGRMMAVGSRKTVSIGHALEVAADGGLVVASGTTNTASDTGRLLPLTLQAEQNTGLVKEVVADSGFFDAGDVVTLQDEGITVVVPDADTACQMRRNTLTKEPSPIHFEPVEGQNAFRCPNGNILTLREKRENGRSKYRAKHLCTACPLAAACLKNPNARRRTLWVRSHAERITAYLLDFIKPEVRASYYARGPGIETVFAFLRRVLGFQRWSVRGSDKVDSEATLLICAYQIRKVHGWSLKAR